MLRSSLATLATSTPGLLGETLKGAGVTRYVLGNADLYLPTSSIPPIQIITTVPPVEDSAIKKQELPTPSQLHREVSCLAMDEDGTVPEGNVSLQPIVDIDSIAGVSTNFPALLRDASRALSSHEFVAVDLGETSRVDAYHQYATEARLSKARKTALKECDEAIGSLLGLLDLEQDTIILCTPTPTRRMIRKGELVTPLVIAGGGVEGGLIASSTTRRKGLVSNYDLAPTILDLFDVTAPKEMTGARIDVIEAARPLIDLVALRDKMVYAHTSRTTLVRVFTITGSIIILLLLLISLLRKKLVVDHPYFWSVVLLSMLSVPFAYLLLPLFPWRHLYYSIPLALGTSIATGSLALLAALLFGRRRQGAENSAPGEKTQSGSIRSLAVLLAPAVFLISGATLILVLIEPFLDSPLMPFSPFGSDMILGGRYYGIGNTYMGVAIGAAILVASLIPTVFPRPFNRNWKVLLAGTGVLLATVLVLGYPRLGANVGALITGVIAALFTLMKLSGRKIGWKQVVAVVLLVLIFLAILLMVDLILPGPASHAGKTFSRVREKGLSELYPVVSRKLSQNWKLMFTSIWRIFFFLLVVAAILWHWRLRIFRESARDYPHLAAAWLGLTVAIIVAILFNDTGIESASALMLFFVVPSFLLFLPGWIKRSDPRTPGGEKGAVLSTG